ncbi:hypothetical protein PG993_005749 [Apiospora rasikravindrae]|uniref:Uncharacterized protein n=1 Tax=Apiospora rasikravindrae TaxID=990691 RepID=A0ABR1T9N5_9PEZI
MGWWSSAPRTVGAGCKPGTAQRGTELYMIEREIRDKLSDEPDFEDLEEMKAYVEAMDFLKKDGTTIDVFFVDKCMKHCRPRGAAPSITSGASRTTASDVGSVSPSTPPTSSSVADSSPAAEIRRHLIPFKIWFAEERSRYLLTHKTARGTRNYISTKVARQCGFANEPGTRLEIALELLDEQHGCVVFVEDIEYDMHLTETTVLMFGTYKPDYHTEDYFHESTDHSSSTAAAARQTSPRSQAASSVRDRDDVSEAATSRSSIRNNNEDLESRQHGVLLDMAQLLIESAKAKRRPS